MYNDASIGSVSKTFELNDSYLVALLVSEQDAGIAALNDVRDQVALKVRNELKAKTIASQLNGLSGSLEDMASAYGDDASVHNTSDLNQSANSLQGVGFAPNVIGAAFALNEGGRSAPLETDNGVVIIELLTKTPAPEIADYSVYKTQKSQAASSRVSINTMEAVKEFADIEDNRYKFY